MLLNKVLTKIVSFLLSLCIILSIPCYANSKSNNIWVRYSDELYGESLYVMELNSGLVLYEKLPDKKMYPASLTKIMTAVVVLDNVGSLSEKLQFSYNAVNKDIDKNSTTIGASAGDVLTVMECLYCILLPSANDAANALAEHVAGNINDFTLLMNEKAEWLGMKNTHFSNPTGLSDENNYTTARDLALLLDYAMSKDEFRQIIQTTTYKHAPIRKYKNPDNSNNTVLNTNSSILKGKYYYQYAIGGKTGYTKDSGYTFASCAAKDGMELLVIDLGCKKNEHRYEDFKKICNFYFKNYKSYNIRELDKRFSDGFTDMTCEGVTLVRALRLTVSKKATVTLPNGINIEDVDMSISYEVESNKDNNAIGTVKYYYDDKLVGSCSLLGLKPEEPEDIHTAYLNISQKENDENEQNANNRKKYINKDKPLYINEEGVITISKPLATFFLILLLLIIIGLFILLFRSRYFIIAKEHIEHKRKMRKLKRN